MLKPGGPEKELTLRTWNRRTLRMGLSQDGPGCLFCFSLLVGGQLPRWTSWTLNLSLKDRAQAQVPVAIPGTGSCQSGLVSGVGLLAILLRSCGCWSGQPRQVGMW